MQDQYAKNNIEWTESHCELFERNGVINLAKMLLQCKHDIKFPTLQQIEKAEKELAKLEKHKTKFIHNPHQQKQKKNYKIKIK